MIATGGAGNQDYLRGLGATATTYGDGLVGRVRDLAPDGVDAALDIAGSGVIEELIELTGNPAKVLSIADFGAGARGAMVSTTAANQEAAYAQAAKVFWRVSSPCRSSRPSPSNRQASHTRSAPQATSAGGS